MTLKEFEQSLEQKKESLNPNDSKLLDLFLQRIAKWQKDDSTLIELMQDLDRVLGSVWFSSDDDHQQVYRLIENFRETADSVDGMTTNERLYIFGLLERWNNSSEHDQKVLETKVIA